MDVPAGIVLCGGQSSRMGRPKALLPFVGEPMLVRVVRRLLEAVPSVVVVAASDQELPPLPTEVRVVRDARRGRGPLQGIAAGLAAVPEGCGMAYVSSCDVPFLRPEFVRRMVSLVGDDQIAVPDALGYRHPLAAVYRTSVLAAVNDLLAEDRLRPAFLFDRVPTRFVTEVELRDADPDLRTLRNLNTPEEYEAALRELSDERM